MFNRILDINKKDEWAINHVIGFCGMNEELILTENDLFLINKFCQLFAMIKKKADVLSGEEFSSIQLVWPAVREIRGHIGSSSIPRVLGTTPFTAQQPSSVLCIKVFYQRLKRRLQRIV